MPIRRRVRQFYSWGTFTVRQHTVLSSYVPIIFLFIANGLNAMDVLSPSLFFSVVALILAFQLIVLVSIMDRFSPDYPCHDCQFRRYHLLYAATDEQYRAAARDLTMTELYACYNPSFFALKSDFEQPSQSDRPRTAVFYDNVLATAETDEDVPEAPHTPDVT